MKFQDLNFEKYLDGVRCRVDYPNGYGASVIRHSCSYGGDERLYEMAVWKDGKFCYTTPITDDVLGWLTPEDVERHLTEIEKLPSDKAST